MEKHLFAQIESKTNAALSSGHKTGAEAISAVEGDGLLYLPKNSQRRKATVQIRIAVYRTLGYRNRYPKDLCPNNPRVKASQVD